MTNPLETAALDVEAALTTWFGAITDCLRPMWAGLENRILALHTVLHDYYVQNDAIYGDTDDGMYRWYHEQARIANLQAEIDAIKERQQMAVDLRQQFAGRYNVVPRL